MCERTGSKNNVSYVNQDFFYFLKNSLTPLVKDLDPYYCVLLVEEFHFYEDAYDMFHIYEISRQIFSMLM